MDKDVDIFSFSSQMTVIDLIVRIVQGQLIILRICGIMRSTKMSLERLRGWSSVPEWTWGGRM